MFLISLHGNPILGVILLKKIQKQQLIEQVLVPVRISNVINTQYIQHNGFELLLESLTCHFVHKC